MNETGFLRDCATGLKRWMVPPGIRAIIQQIREDAACRRDIRSRPYLADNRQEHDKHRGRRCFILCSGPTILQEDLGLLKDEICMTTSTFYKYAQFQKIRPIYHCVPNLDPYVEDLAARYFREMDGEIGPATLFVGASEFEFVKKHRLFTGRTVRFILMRGSRFPSHINGLDLGHSIPCVQSVPILCLLIALFMGFKQIYLLGVDHNWLGVEPSLYCFDRKTVIEWAAKPNLAKDGAIILNRLENLMGCVSLWKQYEAIQRLAGSAHASITNLSFGSALDVFPTARLADVMQSGSVSAAPAPLRQPCDA